MPFAFLTPWILGFLAVLPVLWWLLRVTPPAARQIVFPALMLLRDIVAPSQVPTRTPWWLLVLRLLILAIIIIAFAEPVLHPATPGPSKGALLIAVDNDWAAARAWPLRQDSLRELAKNAEQDKRPVMLLATAPSDQGDAPHLLGPMAAESILNEIDHLQPQPWPADWQKAAQIVMASPAADVSEVIWLASGVGGVDAKSFYQALQHIGPTRVRRDAATPIYSLQMGQGDDPATADQPMLVVMRAQTDKEALVSIAGLATNGDTLTHLSVHFTAGSPRAMTALDVPLELRNRIARFVIDGQTTAAAVLLLDTAWQHRPVGLVGSQSDLDQHSLLNGLFYLDRALKPYADLHIDDLDALLQQKMAMIVLTDNVVLNDSRRAALKDWIMHGGVLVRFAGSRLAEQNPDPNNPSATENNDLLPVTLRTGNRALGGTLSWDVPQKLQSFQVSSPFHGLDIPDDVTVSRQVLAEPAPDLAAHSWASLGDGTPLVTAKAMGQGLSILFHVPVTSDWSNLPLSGLFVDMLRRIVDLSHGVGTQADTTAVADALAPLRTLDGFGELQDAGHAAQALIAGDIDHSPVGPQHPPGLYGRGDQNRAFNLGPKIGQPTALNGFDSEDYRNHAQAQYLKPWLLLGAFVLLLIDFIISLRLRGLLYGFRRRVTVASFLLALLFAAPGHAASADKYADAVEYTSKTYLAYVATGDRDMDQVSEKGLRGLALILQNRTSMDRIAVTAVHPDSDDLALFPLLYWPLAASEQPLSPAGAQHINTYLNHGGMILLDTLSGDALPPFIMEHLLMGIDIPPLVRLPENHVLKHSFYLLDQFSGRYDNSDFWIEPDDASTHDGVATILSGHNGWAAAWAVDDSGKPLFPCSPDGEVQRERAYRFGVNLVMYALTGNYKSDQMHAQALLEKMGH